MSLESFRKGRALTQLELGRALGVSKSYISGLENGRFPVPLKLALKIERFSGGELQAAALSKDAAQLLGPSAGAS